MTLFIGLIMDRDLRYDRTRTAGASSSGLATKSGVIAGASFTGTPKTVTITFATAFADANYSVSVIGNDNRTWAVLNEIAASFDIAANSAAVVTGNVYWKATKHGETA